MAKNETATVEKKKPAAKKKAASVVRTDYVQMRHDILKMMKANHPYTSKQIVVGLDRTPGQKEGGPVINLLKKMVMEKLIDERKDLEYTDDEGQSKTYPGYAWVKKPGAKYVPPVKPVKEEKPKEEAKKK